MGAARESEIVVVGAGSAGAVVAARATERADREVLLLEAGPDYPAREGASLPEDLRDGTRNSMLAHDWGYLHEPTTGQVPFLFPRGRVVGGSSAVNTCIGIRGQPHDYDEWAARGLPEWTWEKCLPAFKRLERDLDFGASDPDFHGNDGPIPLRRHPREELVPWQRAFVDASLAMGFPACADHNRPGTHGVGAHAMNKIDGVRMSAARGYLDSKTRARANLRIAADTLVRRVLFDDRRRVRGVEIERGGRVETIASRKVVLSAGAIATPGILLRSGVGPRATLARLGVDRVVFLPAVGARLLDHPGFAMFLVPKRWLGNLRHPLIQTALRWTSSANGGARYRHDMQMQAGSCVALPFGALPLVSLMAQVGKPRGFGTIEWASADPHARPRIRTRALEDDDDRARAVEAMELAWLLATSQEMREIATPFFPKEATFRRRADIDAWIRSACDSGYHPCGTVPMGDAHDDDAALDQHGRVRGVEGLVVADASVMPTVPTANTNLPTLMIGERFGAWVRDGVV